MKNVTVNKEQWFYLVKMADWAAGQGFCQIEGLEDPDEFCYNLWSRFGPNDGNDEYTAEALAECLILKENNDKI